MFKELLISLFDACNLRYRPVHLLPILFTTVVDPFLLLWTQRIVDLSRNLEFEVDRDMRTRARRFDRIGDRVVIVR